MVVAASLVLSACAAPKIKTRSQTDPNVNLSSYHTYGFVSEPGTNRSGYSTPITTYFKTAITREMNARGYVYSEDSPQLLINFNTNAHEQVDIRSTPSMSYGYGYYGYRGGMYGASAFPPEVETVRYKTGTANVDVVDLSKKQVVWEGIAEARLTSKMMKDPRTAINAVITEMFLQFPGKAGSG